MKFTKKEVCEYNDIECLKGLEIKPQKHQKDLCKFIMGRTNRGILVFHSVGSGKTITSLLTAKCLLEKYPNKNVIITTRTSLTQNFENDMKKIGFNSDKVKIYSYGILLNKLKARQALCSKNILIVDEAHNFLSSSGVGSKQLIECSRKAFKVVLLTATPVKNTPNEISNLMAMLTGDDIRKVRRDVGKALVDPREFKNTFECKVSFYNTRSKENSNYPTYKEYVINLTMTPEYYKEYYKVQNNINDDLPEDIFHNTKDLTHFFNGIRRGVNKIKYISPKVEWTLNKINEDLKDNKKVLIYSTWKDAGIKIIKDILKESGINISEVSGDIPKDRRDDDVKKYNEGKNKIILVTSAGAEGLDLKGTRTIIILEPYWNDTRTEQIIGRGIRYGSHSHLPEDKRNVDIYYLVLHKPKNTFIGDKMKSADVLLRHMSLSKRDLIYEFYKDLEKVSIEKNRKKCNV